MLEIRLPPGLGKFSQRPSTKCDSPLPVPAQTDPSGAAAIANTPARPTSSVAAKGLKFVPSKRITPSTRVGNHKTPSRLCAREPGTLMRLVSGKVVNCRPSKRETPSTGTEGEAEASWPNHSEPSAARKLDQVK